MSGRAAKGPRAIQIIMRDSDGFEVEFAGTIDELWRAVVRLIAGGCVKDPASIAAQACAAARTVEARMRLTSVA